jgi:hypothetical protein
MSEESIFCTQWSGEESYNWFWHEADVLLYALGQEVNNKELTSEQAREIYARRYDVKDTYIVEPEDIKAEKSAILEDWEKYYDSKEEVESHLEESFGEYGNFPLNEELDDLPNSMNFWEEADRLRLPGVGFSNDISPASGPVFMVENDDALAALKQAYEERYRIVFRNDGYDYVIENSREAIEFIERMRE